MTDRAPAGIDPGPVTDWLAAHAGAEPPLRFELYSGGRSNLTFEVTDASGRRLVLRRPPTGHVLASAHDMAREHRVISALHPTPVPVPPPVGLCVDPAVNGADFYVMGHVEGSITFTEEEGLAVDEALRPVMTGSLVDTLAGLHDTDPDEVGLGDLGRREGYCARQLRRWQRQVDEGSDRDLPRLREIHDRLEASIPHQQGAGIVHGDYRLDNCIMDADGAVAAVLDWELCTLGDVLADVAGMVMWWGDLGTGPAGAAEPAGAGRPAGAAGPAGAAESSGAAGPGTAGGATRAPGFGTAADVVERYARSSPRDLSAIDWYLAFQYWRMACIYEGVRVRYAAGAMGDKADDEATGPDFVNELAVMVDYSLDLARQKLANRN